MGIWQDSRPQKDPTIATSMNHKAWGYSRVHQWTLSPSLWQTMLCKSQGRHNAGASIPVLLSSTSNCQMAVLTASLPGVAEQGKPWPPCRVAVTTRAGLCPTQKRSSAKGSSCYPFLLWRTDALNSIGRYPQSAYSLTSRLEK